MRVRARACVENLSCHRLLLHQPSRLTNTLLFLKAPSLTRPLRLRLWAISAARRRNGRLMTPPARVKFINRLSDDRSTPRHISQVWLTQKPLRSDAIHPPTHTHTKWQPKLRKMQKAMSLSVLHNLNSYVFTWQLRIRHFSSASQQAHIWQIYLLLFCFFTLHY